MGEGVAEKSVPEAVPFISSANGRYILRAVCFIGVCSAADAHFIYA